MRTAIREKSAVVEGTYSSLQTSLAPDECLIELESLAIASRSQKVKDQFHGLTEVLQYLMIPDDSGLCSSVGYLTFAEAFDIYSGHQDVRVDKDWFRDLLLHPQHGLPVVIHTIPGPPYRIVALKTPNVCIDKLLREVFSDGGSTDVSKEGVTPVQRTPQEIDNIISAMDSEWDRQCAKLLLSHNKSWEEVSMY